MLKLVRQGLAMMTDVISEVADLMRQASQTYATGNVSRAVELIDAAIRLAENANATELVLEGWLFRALYLTDPAGDLSALVAPTQNLLAFYARQGNILKQLESLLNLAGLMIKRGSKQMALGYLEDAERLLSSLSPSDIDKLSKQRVESAIPTEAVLKFKSDEIHRLRQYLLDHT